MCPADTGLAADIWTGFLAAVLTILWLLSVRLCPGIKERGGWSVPTSLFGFTWLGFGLLFVARFFILSCDSFSFGNFTYRLAELPASVVNEGVSLAAAFWVCLCVGFVFGVRCRGPGPYRFVGALARPEAVGSRFFLTLTTAACIFASEGGRLPSSMVTPVAVLGRAWVIPAAIVWWQHFAQTRVSDRGPSRFVHGQWARWAMLLPGVLQTVLSPYRENLLFVVLIPFVASLIAGRRYRVSTVLIGALGILIASTAVISVARGVSWYGVALEDAIPSVALEDFQSPGSLWSDLMRRLHALDSLLLTVARVPAEFPHSHRNALLGAVVRAMIPRALDPDKEADSRGMEFSTSIWADNDRDATMAAIAPSMPGDLFEAQGTLYVLLGALLWGLTLGVCDGWIMHTPGPVAVAILSLLGFDCALSVEQDFAHVFSTLLQTHVSLVLVVWCTNGLPRLRASARDTPRGLARDQRTAIIARVK